MTDEPSTFPNWLKLCTAVCLLLLGLGVLNCFVWGQTFIGLSPKQTAIVPLFPGIVLTNLIMNHPAYRRLVDDAEKKGAHSDR